jgi:small subunit ribosomal protein S17|tara:strand:- start:9535 stop:9801 length:267 start_codon:yes stop_codon:yes gene_type:complete
MTSRKKIVRTLSGSVVSNKADKTITVMVERLVKHPLYGKYIKRSNKVYADDPQNECQEGDVVTIEETRPLSKTKSWKLSSIDRKATLV